MSRVVILDGATGTELSRRGYDTRLPLWSAGPLTDTPQALVAIHRDYLRAGAQILTTCTFRTHERNLARAGLSGQSDSLNRVAVGAARSAIEAEGAPDIRVAGSLSPLEDCFRVDLVPADGELAPEHERQARSLAEAGVDLLLVETMGCRREAEAAVKAATATGIETWASFVTDGDGKLLSGELLVDAAAATITLGAAAILINCVPAIDIRRAVHQLAAVAAPHGLRFGGYANIGHAHDIDGWQVELMLTPEQFADQMLPLVDIGATLIGGCCGTQPEHIAELKRRLGR